MNAFLNRTVANAIPILVAVLVVIVSGRSRLLGQGNSAEPSVLHISHTWTTSITGFPQHLYMYRVLNGATSTAMAQSLSGTISLQNDSSNMSEVLWELVYWQGECPVNDQALTGANYLWTSILKNPSRGTIAFPVNLTFPQSLLMTGCIGFVFGGGPLFQGKATMSARLDLTYLPLTPSGTAAATIVDLSGEYCFGQDWGCQNATTDDTQGFAVPIVMPAGQLVELFGNISDSTFDGTPNFGPLPTAATWGAINDFYLLPGGCARFGRNLNAQGFPNPAPLTKLYSWLPGNAVHLQSVPLSFQTPPAGTGTASLQTQVENILPTPVTVNAGDCMVVIYGRNGDGASDNETQVKAVLTQ